jgi:hypothetical protein
MRGRNVGRGGGDRRPVEQVMRIPAGTAGDSER